MGIEAVESRESLDVNPGRFLAFVKRRWLPAVGVFALTVAGSVLVATLQEDTYIASAKLLFRIDRTASLTGIGEGVGQLDPVVRTQNPLVTEVEVITSRPLLEQVANELTAQGGEPLTAGDVRNGLTVEILGGADVLKIAYKGENPDLAANIVNELADAYIETNAASNREKTSQARELIESQLPQTEAFVRESELALRRFKEENRVVAIDQEAQSIVAVLQDLDSQILSTQAALEEATTRSAQLRDNLGLTVDQAIVVSDLSQSPAVQGVLQDLQTAERELATQRGFYTDESPAVQTSRAQVESLQSLLRQEVSNTLRGRTQVPDGFLQTGQTRQAMISSFLESEVQRLSLTNRLDALYDSRASYGARSNSLPRLEQQEAELQRRLEVARLSYQSLLQRLQELRVAENQAGGNAQLIEPAVAPQSPASGRGALIVLGGVLVGALLAATVVFLLELKDYLDADEQMQKKAELELEPAES